MAEDKPIAFQFLNSINFDKTDIMTDENEKEYNHFLINHFLSGNLDTVLYANEMNIRPSLDKRMQYDYLRLSIRKQKRFAKWLKSEKSNKLEVIKDYFGYNINKAKQVEDLLSDDDIAKMVKRLDKGGN